MNLWNFCVEQGDQGRYAPELAGPSLHGVVHVAQVLQVRACVGLIKKQNKMLLDLQVFEF